MQMIGREYLTDFCIAEWISEQEEKMFKVYVTDGIKNVNDSVANYIGGHVFKKRYYELISKKDVIDDPEETAIEIKDRIKDKLSILR